MPLLDEICRAAQLNVLVLPVNEIPIDKFDRVFESFQKHQAVTLQNSFHPSMLAASIFFSPKIPSLGRLVEQEEKFT
jgi:hypothetical protein